MKTNTVCLLIILGIFLFSCNKEARPTIQPQTPGLTSGNSEYSVEISSDDFMGVYLPYEYINSLMSTRNHSISIHSYSSKIRDVLAVTEDMIYSNDKWHDQYAIRAAEGDLFKYFSNREETIIIDNNGYTYRKIGDNPRNYYGIADTFVAETVLSELLSQKIGISISDGIAVIPFLYFFTGEDTFWVNLDDLFFEKGLNLLFVCANEDNQFYMGLLIEDNDYYFYSLKRNDDRLEERAYIIYHYNVAQDRNVTIALSGLSDNIGSDYLKYINGLTDREKRIIINTMFALYGYSFVSEEWQLFFSRYSWYKPDINVRNDPDILNAHQRMLLEDLNQE
jgi:hypothetical protein